MVIRIPDNWQSYTGINANFAFEDCSFVCMDRFVRTVEDLILDGYYYIPGSLEKESVTLK